MTPTAWNDIVARQVQVSKLVDYRRALLQFDDSRCLVFRMLRFWTARFVAAAVRPRPSTQPCSQLEAALRAYDYRAA